MRGPGKGKELEEMVPKWIVESNPSFSDPKFRKWLKYVRSSNERLKRKNYSLGKKIKALKSNIFILRSIINTLNNDGANEKLDFILNLLMDALNSDEDKMRFDVENLKDSIWKIIGLRNAEQCMEALKSEGISIERHDGKNTSYDIIFHGLIIHVSSDMDIINDREFSFEGNVTLSVQYDLLQKFINILKEIELPKQFTQEEVTQKRLNLCLSNMENN